MFADVVTEEGQSVARLQSLVRIARANGSSRLLYARIKWEDLMGETVARGALAPETARATLTRTARQKQKLRQMARRRGHRGLAEAIACA